MNELINLGNGQMVKVTMLKGERGSNIATITKTGTSGLTDTYTITLTDGSTTSFEVKNGSSIQSITKTSTVGAVDTYTITLTDGTTAGTFTVTNATGTIDQNFSASSTDPLMNKTLSGIIAGVENGSTASKTYNKNDLILRNDSLYEVQTTVASGGTWADGVNIVEITIGDLLSAVKSNLVGDTIGSLVTVNASNYTSPTNLYTIPYDCYITIHSLASNSQRIQMNDSVGNPIEVVRGDGTYGGNVSLFMRKGMKVYFSADTFTGPTVTIREIS